MNEAAVVIPSRMNHSPARIALVGDYHAEYAAHQGIPFPGAHPRRRAALRMEMGAQLDAGSGVGRKCWKSWL